MIELITFTAEPPRSQRKKFCLSANGPVKFTGEIPTDKTILFYDLDCGRRLPDLLENRYLQILQKPSHLYNLRISNEPRQGRDEWAVNNGR
jgi:hypothetical protein